MQFRIIFWVKYIDSPVSDGLTSVIIDNRINHRHMSSVLNFSVCVSFCHRSATKRTGEMLTLSRISNKIRGVFKGGPGELRFGLGIYLILLWSMQVVLK